MTKSLPVRQDGIMPVTFIATAVIPQYTAVSLDATAEESCKVSLADTSILGISQRATDVVGEYLAVKCDGFTLATAGAAFVIGTELVVGTAGKLVAAVATDIVVAIATQASDADEDVVEVKLVTPYVKA